jgi:hypothetical protein
MVDSQALLLFSRVQSVPQATCKGLVM